jgi:hypothetical protein
MELRETPCGSCYASLCQETTHKIQSRCSLKTTVFPLCTKSHQIRQRQEPTPSPLDKCPHLNKAQKKRIQQIVSSFLYYVRAVEPTILMTLSEIALQQAAPTENTMEHVNQFLDYIWTHPDAIIWYCASDMILYVHSDALYLSAPKACHCAGGYFFLGSIPQDEDPIKLNGAIHITCAILKLVAASAAEAELGGVTKRTLCGIVLFKLITFFVMFLQIPSVDSTCFPHT